MTRVFVSYSRKNQEFVQRLTADLNRHNVPYWLDIENIKPADVWDMAVQKGLESCSHLLLVLSPNSVESRNVLDEVSYALDENKTIVPILISDCTIPFRVRRIQYIDFRADYDSAITRLLPLLPKVEIETQAAMPAIKLDKPPSLSPNMPVISPAHASKLQEVGVLRGHENMVTHIVFSPTQPILASLSSDGTIRVWDVATGTTRYVLRCFRGNGLAFSPDGTMLAAASHDFKVYGIRTWGVSTGQEMPFIRGGKVDLNGLTFNPTGQRIVVGSANGEVRLWDVSERVEVSALNVELSNTQHGIPVTHIAYSPNGNYMLIGTPTSVTIWSQKEQASTTLKSSGRLGEIAVSSDNATMAFATGTNISVWDLPTSNLETMLHGHTNPVTSLTFSPDGSILVSGADDKTLRLWDVRLGKPLGTFTGHEDAITDVAFSPRGKIIASCSLDNTVRLWGIPE
jgi:WD40 repeat protein